MMHRSLRVLIFVDYYLPGFKGGGPVQSVSRMVEQLKDEVEFSIFTRDRDLGESDPYVGIRSDGWTERNGAAIFYASPSAISGMSILQAVRQSQPDVIYLNSLFSKLSRTVLALRALGRLKGAAVLLAPRGEFSPGALRLKGTKKTAFLRLSRALGLFRDLTWHLTSDRELAEARAVIGGDPRHILKAPDLEPGDVVPSPTRKVTDAARFVFFSRISPKKNLIGAIEMMKGLSGGAELTVIGPCEDRVYMERCRRAAADLPLNVRCRFEEAVRPDQCSSALAHHHFLLFPTFGENFGHVIAEALGAGLPVLVSDRTPWLHLEQKGCGWAIPLEDVNRWRETLQACIEMPSEEYARMSAAARACVAEMADPEQSRKLNRALFEFALGRPV